MDNFASKIKEGLSLGELKSIAWHIKGEDSFKPEKCSVRIEDVDGKIFNLVIHNKYDNPVWYGEEETILNVVLNRHRCLQEGMWIGMECSLEDCINNCRKLFPYTDVFFINENDCRINGFISPEHIF